jgi:hypothetical protein
MKINELWNNVIAFGYIVRMFGMDGLKMWQPVKERLNSVGDVPDVSFCPKIYRIAEEVNYNKNDNHNDATIDIADTKFLNTLETSHFLVQHFRIPTMVSEKRENIRTKLIQVAYNIGQAKAEIERGTYSSAVVEFYKSNKLNDITTFLNDADINKLNFDDGSRLSEIIMAGGAKLNKIRRFGM